jgi:transcriptional regulator with XRE-family HTH domain
VHGKRIIVSKVAKAAFAGRLRSIMDEQGLTVGETARRFVQQLPEGEAVSRASLLHYLSGRSMPRLRYLDALCAALGVSTCQLVPDLDSPQRDQEVISEIIAETTSREEEAQGHPASRDRLGHRDAGLSMEDFGSEVHLRIEQRVPWTVALEILRLLKVDP